MPLVIPDNHANILITIQNTTAGASANSTVSIGVEDAGSFWSAADIADIANACRDALTPLFDNSWLLGPVKMIHQIAGVTYVHDDTGTEAGTATSTTYASPAVAHVVTKSTGIAGRKFRGRFYLPGVPEASVDEGGVLAGARVNEVTTACTDLRSDLLALAPVTDVVLFHDSTTPGSSTPTPISSLFCRTVVGTMRPRQRR